MSRLTEESFKSVAEKHGLRQVNNFYFLADCNIIFNLEKQPGERNYAYAQGIIPMELNKELYDDFKDIPAGERQITGYYDSSLDNSASLVMHPDVTVEETMFYAKLKNMDYYQLLQEIISMKLQTDYDNCYTVDLCANSPEAFGWLIETVQAYYKRKKENIR